MLLRIRYLGGIDENYRLTSPRQCIFRVQTSYPAPVAVRTQILWNRLNSRHSLRIRQIQFRRNRQRLRS